MALIGCCFDVRVNSKGGLRMAARLEVASGLIQTDARVNDPVLAIRHHIRQVAWLLSLGILRLDAASVLR